MIIIIITMMMIIMVIIIIMKTQGVMVNSSNDLMVSLTFCHDLLNF